MSEEAIANIDDIDEESIRGYAEGLASGSRKERQEAAAALAAISQVNPQVLIPVGADILDALNRKEARTRWECLEALTNMVSVDARLCEKGLNDAEESLFDEGNGPVRLAAFRFFCKVGQTTPKRAARVWPVIDEAVQCYHGDPEFNDMLNALKEFCEGKIDDDVKKSIADRMAFDASNGRGALKKHAQQIIDIVSAS